MKKSWIFIVLILFMSSISCSYAAKTFVYFQEGFSSLTPDLNCSIILSENVKINNVKSLEKGCVIYGEIFKSVNPKRLQQNAYIVFLPISYTIPSEDNRVVVLSSSKITKIKMFEAFEMPDKKQIAQSVGTTLASRVVPGLGNGITFAKGVANPEEGESRVHSGARHIVESWPFCYCLKGDEMDIDPDTMVLFDFDEKIFY